MRSNFLLQISVSVWSAPCFSSTWIKFWFSTFYYFIITSSTFFSYLIKICFSFLSAIYIPVLKFCVRGKHIRNNFSSFFQALPSRYLFDQSLQWKYYNNVWNLFKVNNKETRTTFKIQRKTLCWSFFSNKIAEACNFIKKGVPAQMFWTSLMSLFLTFNRFHLLF